MMSWVLGGMLSILVAGVNGVAPHDAQPNAVPPVHARPVGGVQLAFEPRHAEVYVDGDYVGLVDEFSGYYHHLELPAGGHYVEILASGYLPWGWEMTIVPGRTITFRMSLEQAPHGR